ncbi:MAG: phospho-N-acetylmuramoyl-pentapeptide-transferase, partial [Thermotogaceae bacterium]|nr:phospho-N-acetylmuramoyl-pentapeptide-transferase [Thermotogaceae bacterium]
MEIFLRAVILFIAFFSTYLLYPIFIDILKKNSVGQFIRKEGPDLHNYKEGTPTMGGLLFIASGSIFGVLMNPVGETFFLVLA